METTPGGDTEVSTKQRVAAFEELIQQNLEAFDIPDVP